MAKAKAKAKASKKASKPAKKVGKKDSKQAAQHLITKDMLIGEVASKYPEAVEIMFKHGMHCIGCSMTAYETIEQGCMGHGLTGEEIDKMVEEMNQVLAKKKN
ncbi:DUF1858 domain-containing protein [Candidatus Woesearchaeota archaeon]|nr:DUF1858 domain-containing protein [Candidatus Woesearchaeota archaeon]